MKISRRETILIIFVIFAISAAAYYFYYLTPTLEKIEQTALSIEQKQIKLISMQTSIENMQNVKNEIETLEAEIAAQSEAIPVGISQPLQLVEMTNILNDKSDGYVISFPDQANTFENYQTTKVDVNFATNYENLLVILDEFDDLEMTNQIVDINILYADDPLNAYSALLDGYYLSVGFIVEFYAFYEEPGAQPPEKQPFESNPVEYKNPFRPTLN